MTAGSRRSRPCRISPSVRLTHASAAQRTTSASKRAQSAKARQKRKSPATSVSARPKRCERRRPAAPRLAAVDDVVVQQRGRVDQLERDRGLDGVVAAGALARRRRRGRPAARPAGARACRPRRTRCAAISSSRGSRDVELGGEPLLDAREVVAARPRGMAGRGDGRGCCATGSPDTAELNEMPAPKSRTRTYVAFRVPRSLLSRAWRTSRRERVREALRAVLFPGLPARRGDARHGDRRARRRGRGAPSSCGPAPTRPRCARSSCASIERGGPARARRHRVRVALAGAAQGRGRDPFAGRAPLPGVQHVIAVSSAKGGRRQVDRRGQPGARAGGASASGVGLADMDVYGPSMPIMLGIERAPAGDRRAAASVPIERYGVKLMSMGFFLDEQSPVIWRGPIVMGIVRQFLHDVDWAPLEFLVVDLPPGHRRRRADPGAAGPARGRRHRHHAAGRRAPRRRRAASPCSRR